MTYPIRLVTYTPTDQQALIIYAISKLSKDKGYPPSLRELAEAVELSLTATRYHVGRLKDEGVLTYEKHQARTLQIVK